MHWYFTRGTAAAVVAGIVTINCGAPVLAQTGASTKSAAIEGRIAIDKSLTRDKKLAAFLLKEGRSTLAEQRRNADLTRKADLTLFRNGPWTFQRVYKLRAEAGPYISVLRVDYSYTGGAHPNTRLTTLLWNRSTAREVDIFRLFKDAGEDGPTLSALAGLIRETLAAEKRKRGLSVAPNLADDEWLRHVTPKVEEMGQPSLAPSTEAGKASGMTFHFSPYDVGPYVQGSFTAFIPASALAPLLSPDARAIFGGTRPPIDVASTE